MGSKWEVRTVSGVAGGMSRDATVNLTINCKADTVEEVRAAVAALPALVAALQDIAWTSMSLREAPAVARAALAKITDNHPLRVK